MNYKQSIALELHQERRADVAHTLSTTKKNVFYPPLIMDF